MQYDSSDSTPSMAFNVLASYANAGKFNSRQSAAVTALKIIPCFSCSSSTTDVARQLATVRGRYRGSAFTQLWRPAGLLADDFHSAGFGPSFVIRTRWIGPSSPSSPSSLLYIWPELNSWLPRFGAGRSGQHGEHRVKQAVFRASGGGAAPVRQGNHQSSACCRPD